MFPGFEPLKLDTGEATIHHWFFLIQPTPFPETLIGG